MSLCKNPAGTGHEIHTHNTMMLMSLHTCKELSKDKAITFTIASRGIKYLGVKFIEIENLDSEHHTTLSRGTEDLNRDTVAWS